MSIEGRRVHASVGGRQGRDTDEVVSVKQDDDELERVLQPMDWHGVDFTAASGDQRHGTCPWCGKKKFYANRKTGLWDCKVCGVSGNLNQFLERMFNEVYRPAYTETESRAFAEHYHLPLDALDNVQLGYGPRGYVFPICDVKGRMVNLRTKALGQKTLGTKGIGGPDLGLWSVEPTTAVDRSVPHYLCEGETDALAVRWKLRARKKAGVVWSIPGASSFHQDWVDQFRGCTVRVLYDNDEAGAKGDALLYQRLHGVVKELTFLSWPDDEEMQGWDVRDYLTRGKAWSRLVSWFSADPRSRPDDDDELADLRPERFDAFAERLAQTIRPPDLITDLMPGQGITLLHSQPRTQKTWVALECAIAMATGTPAFGSSAHAVPTARRVLYLTEEDPPIEIRDRVVALLAGRGIEEPPTELLVAVKQGWDLDNPVHQTRLIDWVQTQRVEVLILDPLRSVTASTDKSWSELRPFILFLRRLQRETGVLLLLTHHDTKPVPGVIDTRDRPQRMSGGGLFSVVDAPIHLSKVKGDSGAGSLLVPSNYKFSAAPPPVRLLLETDDPKVATSARLVAFAVAADSVTALEQDEKVLAYLREHPDQEFSGRGLRTALGKGQKTVRTSLDRLLAAKQVERRRVGGDEQNAQLWRLAKAGKQPASTATPSRSKRR
jgi:hypothetical protein